MRLRVIYATMRVGYGLASEMFSGYGGWYITSHTNVSCRALSFFLPPSLMGRPVPESFTVLYTSPPSCDSPHASSSHLISSHVSCNKVSFIWAPEVKHLNKNEQRSRLLCIFARHSHEGLASSLGCRFTRISMRMCLEYDRI